MEGFPLKGYKYTPVYTEEGGPAMPPAAAAGTDQDAEGFEQEATSAVAVAMEEEEGDDDEEEGDEEDDKKEMVVGASQDQMAGDAVEANVCYDQEQPSKPNLAYGPYEGHLEMKAHLYDMDIIEKDEGSVEGGGDEEGVVELDPALAGGSSAGVLI